MLGERERPLLSLELERILEERLPLELRDGDRDCDREGPDRDRCLLRNAGGGEVTVELTVLALREGTPPGMLPPLPPLAADGEFESSGNESPPGLTP